MISLFKSGARSALALSIAILSLGVSVPGIAEPDDTVSIDELFGEITLEEIVVTATRRTSSQQVVAASISTVDGKSLEKKGITQLQGLSDTISGITFHKPESPISSGVYIRGVGTGGTSPAVQSVGVLVDDVYQVISGTAFTEMFDVNRVEVLRGPQGTLFGKNTTAGVIRLYTADPETDKLSGKIQAIAGNFEAREYRGVLNVPVIEDKMALRISGFNASADGYTQNTFLDVDTRNTDREGFRIKWLWDVSDNFQVKLSGEDIRDFSRSDRGNVSGGVQANGTVASFDVQPSLLGNAQEDVLGLSGLEVERYIFNMRWSFPGHTLTTISSKEESNLYLKNDETENPLEMETIPVAGSKDLENLTDIDIETHEIQLASDNDSALNYLLGIYWQDENTVSDTHIDGSSVSLTEIPVKSEAVFGNISYEFNEQWSASIGVRHTEDERAGRNNILNPAPVLLAANHEIAPTVFRDVYGISRDLTIKTFRETTYSFKLTHQYDEDTMIYLAHDKGFKSGGIQRDFPESCLFLENVGNPAPTDFSSKIASGDCISAEQTFWEPETSLNYEIGIKSELLGNTLRLNTALFYQTYDDFQVTQNRSDKNSVLVSNAAKVNSMGIETELTWLATSNLEINGSITYVESEYDNYSTAPCRADEPACTGTKDFSGKTLDHAPKLSAYLGSEYRDTLDSLDGGSWFGGVDVIFRSSQNLNVDQPEIAEQGSYALVNARVGIETSDETWKFTFWGKNVFDRDYLTDAEINNKGTHQFIGPPRTFGVTADYSF